jgi:hypothetical protein
MKRSKATVPSVLTMLTLVVATCPAQEQAKDTREAKAKQVASAWFQSLMRGDTAVTTALSDVPFAMDRKQTIESIGELEKMLESVVKEKGKREIKPSAIKIAEDQIEIQKQAFPANFIIVHIMIDDEGVALCVKPGDTFKVVGLSD